MADLTIEINLSHKLDEDSQFRRIHEIYDLFEAMINELSDLSVYEIKVRGQWLSYWLNHPTVPFREG